MSDVKTNSPQQPATPREREALEYLVHLGRGQGERERVDMTSPPYVVIPQGYKVESLAHLAPPGHIAATVKCKEVAAFCDYVRGFRDASSPMVFADVGEQGGKLMAIMDWHWAVDPESIYPERAAHRVIYETQATPEWKTWTDANKRKMGQEAFALFLEEHGHVVQSPNAAELLELVLNLEGKADVRFSSAMRLNNGKAKLVFEEDVAMTGTKVGNLEVPEVLTLGMAPFEGVAPVLLPARLKYRIESRKLILWYELVQPHLIVRAAIRGMMERVKTETGLAPIAAWPQ